MYGYASSCGLFICLSPLASLMFYSAPLRLPLFCSAPAADGIIITHNYITRCIMTENDDSPILD